MDHTEEAAYSVDCTLDLSTNPNAPIALVIIPVYALVPIGVGGAIGYVMDRILRRSEPS